MERWYFNLSLLAAVAAEWERIRAVFRFTCRTPHEYLEEVRTEILKFIRINRKSGSAFEALCREMSADRDLLADLRHAWRCIPKFKKRGYEFDDVGLLVVSVLFWRSVRNAGKYGVSAPCPPRGWANVYWYHVSLKRELKRNGIDALNQQDRTAVQVPLTDGTAGPVTAVPLSLLQRTGKAGDAPSNDVAEDYRGRAGEPVGPEQDDPPEWPEAFVTHLRQHLSAADLELLFDRLNRGDEEMATTAGRHGREVKCLKKLLKRVVAVHAAWLKTNPPTRG